MSIWERFKMGVRSNWSRAGEIHDSLCAYKRGLFQKQQSLSVTIISYQEVAILLQLFKYKM